MQWRCCSVKLVCHSDIEHGIVVVHVTSCITSVCCRMSRASICTLQVSRVKMRIWITWLEPSACCNCSLLGVCEISLDFIIILSTGNMTEHVNKETTLIKIIVIVMIIIIIIIIIITPVTHTAALQRGRIQRLLCWRAWYLAIGLPSHI